MLVIATLAIVAMSFALPACSDDNDGDSKDDAGTTDGGGNDGGGTIDDGATTADGSATTGDGTVAKDTGGNSGKDVLVPRSLRFKESIRAVWGSSASDVWWAGDKGRVLHFNGSILVPRRSGTDKNLHGVWGRAKDDVWFGGEGVILFYNGSKFFDRTPKGLIKPVFRAVHAPSDGSTLLIAGKDGVIYRVLDDNTLHKENTNSGVDVHGLFAASAGTIWGVGGSGQALKLSGGSWSETTMPKASGTITAISGAKLEGKTRMFAVGQLGYVAATEDGKWKSSLSNDPKSRDLRGVWAVGGKEAWAIGKNGALIHLTGDKWNVQDIDGTYMKTASFNAVWGVVEDGKVKFAHAVGDDGAGLTFQKGKWLDFRAETAAHVLSVTALDDGRLVATGASGLLMVAKDATSEFIDLGAAVTGATLHDAAGDGAAGGFWAVGDKGVAVHVAKSGGIEVMTPAAAQGRALRGVVNAGKDGVFAVGDLGTIVVWKGTSWAAEKTTVQHTLRSVAATGGKVWAVGDFGTVLRRDGGTWKKESTGELARFNRAIATQDGGIVAVGDNGVIVERDKAGNWAKRFEQPGLFLYGVAATPDGRIVAAGWKGTLVVGKAGKYSAVESKLPNVLRDIAATKTGIVAVGHKGGIYQVKL